MDESLSLDTLDAPRLRMLLAQERTRRQEVEQEVSRLRPDWRALCDRLPDEDNHCFSREGAA